MQDMKKLRELVRRDAAGKPRESDITRALSLVREIRKRITLVEDHQKKATRYMGDITEYLLTLEGWGIVYREEIPLATPPVTSAPTVNIQVAATATPAKEGLSVPAPKEEPKKVLTAKRKTK